MSIKFRATKSEKAIIAVIAARAVFAAYRVGVVYDIVTASMDITAVHSNGCRLRLQELLDADDFNFAHDVFGIKRHLDRTTGKLQDCFVPRYTDKEKKS